MNVLLVDDHPVMRQALRALLPLQNPAIVIVGEASTAQEALPSVEALVPDLVIVDLMMPGSSGVVAIRALRKYSATIRIMAYSALSLPAIVLDVLSAGADAYVLKTGSLDELTLAIDRVGRGDRYLSPSLESIVSAAAEPSGLAALSRREREVFDLLLQGNSNTELASQLFISPKTVETHRARINKKLGVRSTGELIRFAAINGLVSS